MIVKMIVEKQMECRLGGETEAPLLSITKSHMINVIIFPCTFFTVTDA
jgi:hypothetical protein